MLEANFYALTNTKIWIQNEHYSTTNNDLNNVCF